MSQKPANQNIDRKILNEGQKNIQTWRNVVKAGEVSKTNKTTKKSK